MSSINNCLNSYYPATTKNVPASEKNQAKSISDADATQTASHSYEDTLELQSGNIELGTLRKLDGSTVNDRIVNDPALKEYMANRPALWALMEYEAQHPSKLGPYHLLDGIQARVNGGNGHYMIPAAENLTPEGKALWDNANEEAFQIYLQEQNAAGNTTIEHDFFSSENRDARTGGHNVDEYGYTTLPSGGWYAGNGHAVQTENGFTNPFKPHNIDLDTLISNPFGLQNTIPKPFGSQETEMIFGSHDSVNLPGLTLEERKIFLDRAQSLLEKHGIQDGQGDILNVLEHSFSFKINSSKSGKNLYEIYFDQTKSILSLEDFEKVKEIFSSDNTLQALAAKALQNRGGNVDSGRYSIRVTDFEGNALAKDRIIVESKNGHHVEMSVSDFAKLDRKEIAAMLR